MEDALPEEALAKTGGRKMTVPHDQHEQIWKSITSLMKTAGAAVCENRDRIAAIECQLQRIQARLNRLEGKPLPEKEMVA